jgi:hypothetical protein
MSFVQFPQFMEAYFASHGSILTQRNHQSAVYISWRTRQ